MPKLKLRVAFEAKEQSARVACKAKVHSSAAKGPGWYLLSFLSLELIVESGEGKQRSVQGRAGGSIGMVDVTKVIFTSIIFCIAIFIIS